MFSYFKNVFFGDSKDVVVLAKIKHRSNTIDSTLIKSTDPIVRRVSR